MRSPRLDENNITEGKIDDISSEKSNENHDNEESKASQHEEDLNDHINSILEESKDAEAVAKHNNNPIRIVEEKHSDSILDEVPSLSNTDVDNHCDVNNLLIEESKEAEEKHADSIFDDVPSDGLPPADDSDEDEEADGVLESDAQSPSIDEEVLMSSKKLATGWPKPFRDFKDYKLLQEDRELEQFVALRGKILIRTITWNLCANPPPFVSDLMQSPLFGFDK